MSDSGAGTDYERLRQGRFRRRRLMAASVVEQVRLRITPITLREANAYVAANHRHHGETRGCIVVCACSDAAGDIRGVGIAGRPVARLLQDGFTAEVTRLCTDGAPNACSMLYRALWRAVRALGYSRLVTYTLPQEGGSSLLAAGFKLIGQAGGGTWDRPLNGRPRVDLHPTQEKLRWELSTDDARHSGSLQDPVPAAVVDTRPEDLGGGGQA